MPLPQGYTPAELKCGTTTIKCAFNPTDFTVSKTNVWTFKPTQSKDRPEPEWGGGLPQVYKLHLLLDDTIKRPGKPPESVTKQANTIMEGFHKKGAAPPDFEFTWGAVKLSPAKPVSVSIRYALFKPNGEPIRAFVDIELAQAKDSNKATEGQNPTTRATPGLRAHRVRDGDSLPSIAYEHYGDATRWRAIAEANDISDPMRLRRGADLTIPRLT